MVEPMFGAVSPIWSAIPAPGVTWFQAPMPGSGAVGGTKPTTSPLSGEPYRILSCDPASRNHLRVRSVQCRCSALRTFRWCHGAGAGLGHCYQAGAAGRTHQRSGNRGLHLRRARAPAWIQRRGSALRRRTDVVDGCRDAEAAEAGHRRDCLGHSQHQRCPEQHHDRSETPVAIAES